MSDKITISMLNKLAEKHNLYISGPTKCTVEGYGKRVGWNFWAFERGNSLETPDRVVFQFWPTKKAVLKAMYNTLNTLK